MAELKSCFVIAPIGKEKTTVRRKSDQLLNYVISPVVKRCGFSEPVRADHLPMPGIITSQILERIAEDDLVVADLTGANANVFYELAIRHAIRKPVVHLIDKSEKIPFDVSMSRAIPYDLSDPDSIEEASHELARQVLAVMENPEKADNPISIAMDLRALRRSDDPERRSLAELADKIARISTDVRAIRHDANALDRLKVFEKIEGRFKAIEESIADVKSGMDNIDGVYDLDDIMSRLDDIEGKLE